MVESERLSELTGEALRELWNKADDAAGGWAGGWTQGQISAELDKRARQNYSPAGQIADLTIDQEERPSLIPMSLSEKRRAAEIATQNRLQPGGKYRRSRTGRIKSPIDDSAGMRGITEAGMRRARSKS